MDYKNIETYDYDLDESLIAQTPIKERDHSKLLIVNRKDGNYKDEVFYNIINYLHKGDVLVLNNTKVLPSRIIGYKTDTNAKIEVLLLTDLGNNVWECLVRPQKRVHIGTVIKFDDDFTCEVVEVKDNGIGIPTNEINNVMKRFYKVDKSRVNNNSFGIGLSIANRIANNYNAKIQIDSELDKYTKISVYFN